MNRAKEVKYYEFLESSYRDTIGISNALSVRGMADKDSSILYWCRYKYRWLC